LHCLQRLCRDREPGDEEQCPLCKREFKIPFNGVDGLPVNDIAQTSEDYCDSCDDDETDRTGKKAAVKFCVDCNDRLCQSCVESHQRKRLLQNHRLVEIKDQHSAETDVRGKEVFCNEHKKEAVKLYCFTCKAVTCLMCFVENHQWHKCSDVDKVASEFREQMKNDTETTSKTIARCRKMIEQQKISKTEFVSKVDKVEKEICEQVEKLKQRLDEERMKLTEKLIQCKQDQIGRIENSIQETEKQVSLMENLVKYTDEMRTKSTASEIAQQINYLHIRAHELVNLDTIQKVWNGLGSVEFTFSRQPLEENLVGELTVLRVESGTLQLPQRDVDVVEQQSEQHKLTPSSTGKYSVVLVTDLFP
jgi:hypothetical protein